MKRLGPILGSGLLVLACACGGLEAPADEAPEPEAEPVSSARVEAAGPDGDVHASLRAEPAVLNMGDRIELVLEIRTEPDHLVLSTPHDLPPLVLLDAEELEAQEPDTARWRFDATVFELGDLEVGPLTITWREPEGEERSLELGPLALSVVSVLEGEDEELADIRGPLSVPRDWTPWLRAAGIAGAVAAAWLLLWALWRWWRRRIAEGPRTPDVPAHVLALDSLEALKARGLPGPSEIKGYYVELSETIRRYIEGRFRVEALERTTRELDFELRRTGLRTATVERVLRWLGRCDLVKFARFRPAEAQIRADLEEAFALVRETMPRREPGAAEAHEEAV